MVKTLRITTILIALTTLGFIILIASKGVASDREIEKFLGVPGAAEHLKNNSGSKSTNIEQDTPLIRHAKAFALRINPPPAPEPERTEPVPQEEIRPKVSLTAKFTLVGTSYYKGDEENSWALIDEVGKGWHWVRQGETVGYLVVEKIGDGVVLIRDGEKSYELTAERQKKPDYVTSFTGKATPERTIPDWQGKAGSVAEAVSEDRTMVSNTENTQTGPTVESKSTKEEIQENVDWIKQLQENPESIGMTKEEANELGDLGEFLETVEDGLPKIDSNEPNTSSKPVLPKVKDANENQRPRISRKDQKPQDPNQQGQNNAGPRGLRKVRRPRE